MNEIKCLVLSDSHGRVDNLRRAVKRRPDVDAVIFLGDGLSDLEYLLPDIQSPVLAVRGNCDFGREYLGRPVYKVDSITLADKKIIFTHGDLYGAKYGHDGLVRLAEQTDADIILYGHTHIKDEKYIDGKYYLNPGTVAGGGLPATAGLLTLTDSGVLFSFIPLDY